MNFHREDTPVTRFEMSLNRSSAFKTISGLFDGLSDLNGLQRLEPDAIGILMPFVFKSFIVQSPA